MSADRKACQRERDRKAGVKRYELRLDAAEIDMLSQLAAARRPGRSAYTPSEYIGLLLRQDFARYQAQLLLVGHCRKCGDKAPVTECVCEGDSDCWRTYGPLTLALSL